MYTYIYTDNDTRRRLQDKAHKKSDIDTQQTRLKTCIVLLFYLICRMLFSCYTIRSTVTRGRNVGGGYVLRGSSQYS